MWLGGKGDGMRLYEINNGKAAEEALDYSVRKFTEMFEGLGDAYLSARAADMKDIAAQIMASLTGEDEQTLQNEQEPYILVADDLSPSETVMLEKSMILGFVTFRGTPNSHTAILARAMGIPALVDVGVVDAYATSLTRSTPTALSVARWGLAATSVGNYALFGGGAEYGGTSKFNTVDAYNSSLTRSTPTALSAARHLLAATTVGNHALFGGGNDSGRVVDAYNTSLTRSTPTALKAQRSAPAATTVENYALFGGAGTGVNDSTDCTDVYDDSLTKTTSNRLSDRRSHLAATTVGIYALFGGGTKTLSDINVVDAYVFVN